MVVFVISVIIDSIDKKRKDPINKSQEGYFIVKKPDAIKYLANFIIIFGLLGALFLVFC